MEGDPCIFNWLSRATPHHPCQVFGGTARQCWGVWRALSLHSLRGGAGGFSTMEREAVGPGLLGDRAARFEYGCEARLSNQQLEEVTFIFARHHLRTINPILAREQCYLAASEAGLQLSSGLFKWDVICQSFPAARSLPNAHLWHLGGQCISL